MMDTELAQYIIIRKYLHMGEPVTVYLQSTDDKKTISVYHYTVTMCAKYVCSCQPKELCSLLLMMTKKCPVASIVTSII